jgi:photosystem II stability/assembly factor-like uncharacterized protein
MTTIYVALDDRLLVVRGSDAEPRLEGRAPRCLAADPRHPERVWCGTEDSGVWRSEDAGATWRPAGEALSALSVSAVAVGPGEEVVYAGIDQSALWRSDDAGRRWEALPALNALPSAPTWSFPPRPETSHVRWITLDPAAADRLAVCIEAGALVRSSDGGRTWTDRTPDGPYDTHVLAAHPAAPGRLYSAAGDGFMAHGRGYSESSDGGDTWERPDEGIERHYLYGLAVDPGDPDTILVSAANSPMEAHSPAAADSTIYRRSGGGPWREAREGLPEPKGSLRALFATHPGEPGTFYAVTNWGLFRSADGGRGWEPVVAPLPGAAAAQPHAIAATP